MFDLIINNLFEQYIEIWGINAIKSTLFRGRFRKKNITYIGSIGIELESN